MTSCNQILWVCQVNGLPPVTLVIIFLSFDIAIMLTIYLFYHLSISETQLLSKNKIIEKHRLSSELDKFLLGIKLNFLGTIFISINNIISHGSVLVARSYGGYFLAEFYAIFTLLGFMLIFSGGIVFQRFFKRIQIQGRSNIFFVLIVSAIILSLLGIGTIWRVSHGQGYFEKTHINILVGLLIFIIAVNIFHTTYKINYNNNVAEVRKILIATIYSITILFLVFGSFFIPIPSLPEQYHLNKTSAIEILLFGYNLYILLVAYLLYMIVKIPKWFRKIFNITDEEMREFHYDFLGIKPISEVILEADKDDELPLKNRTIEDLHKGFIVFSSFHNDLTSHFINILDNKTEIIEQFSIEAVNDMFYYQEVRYRSNEIYLIHEIEEILYSLMDGIYDQYGIEIEIEKDIIYYNRQLFDEPKYKFALIFSGINPNSEDRRMYLMVFPPELGKRFGDFLDNYFNFLEDQTYEGWYTMLVIFEIDETGKILPIPPDPNDPNKPNSSNFKILNR